MRLELVRRTEEAPGRRGREIHLEHGASLGRLAERAASEQQDLDSASQPRHKPWEFRGGVDCREVEADADHLRGAAIRRRPASCSASSS